MLISNELKRLRALGLAFSMRDGMLAVAPRYRITELIGTRSGRAGMNSCNSSWPKAIRRALMILPKAPQSTNSTVDFPAMKPKLWHRHNSALRVGMLSIAQSRNGR